MQEKVIAVITMVKNEADIIETFLRYSLRFADLVLIYDDGSSDNTLEIVGAISDEFPGRIIFKQRVDGKDLSQVMVMNSLMSEAFTKYDVDMLIPLDADEFPVAERYQSPRAFMETLAGTSACYLQQWRIFCPSENVAKAAASGEVFNLADYNKAYTSSGFLHKVIITRSVWAASQPSLFDGSHSILPSQGRPVSPIHLLEASELYLAHFPIRSITQLTEKAAVKWLKRGSDAQNPKDNGKHIKRIFELLCDGKVLDYAFLEEECRWYSIFDRTIPSFPITISYFQTMAPIAHRYPVKRLNSITYILNKANEVAIRCVNLQKDVAILKDETKAMAFKMATASNERDHLLVELNAVRSSRAWRLTQKIWKISAFLLPYGSRRRNCIKMLYKKFR